MTQLQCANPDPVDVLAKHRPSEDRIEALWPDQERAQVLATVAAVLPPVRVITRRGPRRKVVYRLAAAAVLAVAVVGGALFPRGALPEASALDRLAAVAAVQPALSIPQGRYFQQTTTSHQQGIAQPDKTGGFQSASESRTRVTWTSADGRTWARETSGGLAVTFAFAAPTDGSIASTPAAVAALPSEPGALETYLRAHVGGSTSPDEAVFTYIGDITRTGYVPTAVRTAAIQVLRTLPGVTSTPHDGRLDVAFVDHLARPGVTATLTFDERTSALVRVSLVAPELQFSEEVGAASVVDAVPADVLSAAVSDGGTVKSTATGAGS